MRVCSWAWLRKTGTVKPKVVGVYPQVKPLRSSVFLLVCLIFFPWHVQPLFLGVESLFVLKSVRREEPEAIWQGYTWSISQLLFLGCNWPVFTFFFFSPSIKSSCSSLCLSNTVLTSWREICDREEKPPGPPVAVGRADGSWQGWL